MRPSLETTGFPFGVAVACLLLQLAYAVGGEPPAGDMVKVTEYTLVDGRKVGVQEWSTLSFASAVPCEVQANAKAKPCSKCDACDCTSRTGGCACEANAKKVEAETARLKETALGFKSQSARLETILSLPALHRSATGVLTYTTVRESVAMGGPLTPEFIAAHNLTTEDVAAVHAYLPRPASVAPPVIAPSAAPVYAAPQAAPMPARGALIDTGVYFRGPFGGSVGAGVCVPGGA